MRNGGLQDLQETQIANYYEIMETTAKYINRNIHSQLMGRAVAQLGRASEPTKPVVDGDAVDATQSGGHPAYRAHRHRSVAGEP